MLEVDIDVAVLSECGEAFDEGVEFGLCIGSSAAEAEAGVSGSGVDLGGVEVVGLVAGMSNAERGVVLAEDGIDLFGEPGFVAELEGDGWRAGSVQCWCSEEL